MKSADYYIKARLFPTILCSVPLILLYYFGFSEKVVEFINFLKDYKWVSDVSISVAIIYLMVQINRFVAKEVFQSIFFKDEHYMPTTNFLLHTNTFFAKSTQSKIREKIKSSFDIDLLNEKEEKEDESEARKVIVHAVAQIRNSTRNNSLLLQHNIEYGFIRNFIGGSTVAFLISLANLYIFKNTIPNELAFNISLICLIAYVIPIILSRFLVVRYGKYYAKVLFEQFMDT